MRIQEMRSGSAYLKKRMTHEETDQRSPFRQLAQDYAPGGEPAEARQECALYSREWSVVSFDRVEACGLTHSQAVQFMAKLDSEGICGLCIVTDSAAARS